MPNESFSLPSPTAPGPLLPWLLEALRPMNRTRVKQLLRHGRVSIKGKPTSRHDYLLQPGDQVTILQAASVPADKTLLKVGISIILEDTAVIVIDKPPGLLTVATAAEKLATAFACLNAHLTIQGQGRPFVVHRLDRETSGLLMFARSAAIRDHLQANWEQVSKTYLAVVEGKPRQAHGVVKNFLVEGRDLRVRVARGIVKGAQHAVSRYRVVAVHGRYSLVEVDLETGRKHQIRVHMAELGCPVIGDPMYGSESDPAGRLGLHAHRLAVDHPTTGKRLELESPLPAVLQKLMGR